MIIGVLKLLGPSLTSRVVATAGRAVVRPQLDRLRLDGIQLHYLRGVVSFGGTLAGWPTTARVEQVVTPTFSGEWVQARNFDRETTGVILCFHGGGYVASSPRAYRCARTRC